MFLDAFKPQAKETPSMGGMMPQPPWAMPGQVDGRTFIQASTKDTRPPPPPPATYFDGELTAGEGKNRVTVTPLPNGGMRIDLPDDMVNAYFAADAEAQHAASPAPSKKVKK